jgi:hypothetical protein
VLESSNHPYSIFRVRMTGYNSNSHMLLCISGFEIYGTTCRLPPPSSSSPSSSDVPSTPHINVAPPNSTNNKTEPERKKPTAAVNPNAPVFKPMQAFSEDHGVIFKLGSAFGSRSWENPNTTPLANGYTVGVTCSSVHSDSLPKHNFLGRIATRTLTGNSPDSWFIVDFGVCVCVRVSVCVCVHVCVCV